MSEALEFDPRLSRCPLCDSPQIRPFDRDFRGCGIDRCEACGVRFMNPQYSDRHLARFYSKYINVHDQDGPPAKRYRSRSDVRTASKTRCLELIARFVDKGPILMVGCGDGLELAVARDLGWEPHGYDIDEGVTAEVAAKFGVPVHSGRFTGLQPVPGGYAAVFMDQVIEHPKDPATYLAHARELLRPGGVLFLGTPNIGSLANSFKTAVGRAGLRHRKRGKHYATKHHIFYFTPQVMRGLLARFGFEVLVLRGSLKPQHNPLTSALSHLLPRLDSSMLVVARRPS